MFELDPSRNEIERHSGAGDRSLDLSVWAYNMKYHQIILAVLTGSLSLGTSAAYAIECIVKGPRYALTSDMVDWSMRISSGQSCIRGLRFSDVVIESLRLVSPAQTGQITLSGPSFTYSAKSDFRGEDFFVVEVWGTIHKSRGSSTIRISVSVGDPASAAPSPHARSPAPSAATKPPVSAPVDNNRFPSADGSLPPCPTWDWSNGLPPPPMRPPFDRAKLYCPPPPFEPPSLPIGCRCEK
jgi:hypothetical protein